MTAGRGRMAAVGRLVVGLGAVGCGALLVLAGSLGPRYGRTQRVTVAVQLGSRLILRSLGVRVRQRGMGRDGAALVVANHVSWIDILVIAASTPVVPVAKCEVADWPVVGALARRTGTIFVPRRAGRDLPVDVGRIAALLRRGHRVLLFPEGTTTAGGPPATFRRAGFQAAVDAATPVHPVSLRYLDARGRTTTAPAFLGDDTLFASAWRVVRAGALTVELRWLPAVPAVVDGGHRAGHRARAAGRAHGRISRALGRAGVMSVSIPVSAVGEPGDRPVTLGAPDRAA